MTDTRQILAWEDDPFSGSDPIRRPPPDPPPKTLGLAIAAKAPPLRVHAVGTPAFRYWTGIEALTRGIGLFAPHLGERGWAGTRRLRIHLDRGEDLNAYYDRTSLSFFHDTVGERTIYTGESPDVVTHELGHAVLDALRPELWNVMSAEAAAFHESFGDVAAILSALELPSVRAAVMRETKGRLFRSSRLSRIAESLGWAIRQGRPDLVAPDALRNAVNAFFYRPARELPPSGPDAQLTSEPHSFSRVFTAGIFEALALMVAGAAKKPGEAHLLASARALATLLVAGIGAARIVPAFFAEVATRMLEADRTLFAEQHGEALRTAFVRRGILSLRSAIAAPARRRSAPRVTESPGAELPLLRLPGAAFGLGRRTLLVVAPAEPAGALVAGSARAVGSAAEESPEEAARAFVEYLVRRGRVALGRPAPGARPLAHPRTRKTHRLLAGRGGATLVRHIFDCGLDPGWG